MKNTKKSVKTVETVKANDSAKYQAALEQGLSVLNGLVKEYNDKKNNGASSEVLEKIEERINDYVKKCNKASCMKSFEEFKNSDDPLYTALMALTYKTVKVSNKSYKNALDETIRYKAVDDTDSPIDLELLWIYCDKNIGVNSQWVYMCHKLNLLMTCKTAEDIGVDVREINDSFAMNAIAKDIDLGETPCSKTNMLKTLNSIVQAMIGEKFKCTSHDVNYLLRVYSKKGRKALTVTTSNNRQLITIVCEICHRLLTDGEYAVEYKKAKNA